MMGLSLVSADDGAVAGVRTLLHIINLLVDRDVLVAELRKYADILRDARLAIDELKEREEQVLRHGREIDAAAEALAKERADLAEERQQAQAELQRAEEAKASLAAMKVELRQLTRLAA
jgi:hypothetical protein